MIGRCKKIACVLSLWLLFLSVHAQTDQVLVKKEFVNTPLIEVLQWLEKEYQIKIAYSREFVDDIIVNQSFDNLPLNLVFDQLLRATPLTSRFIRRDRILVGPSEMISAAPQSDHSLKIIKGKVLDNSGDGLAFAHVFHPPTETGVFADEAGNFDWPLKEDSIRLQFSYVGFKTAEATLYQEMTTFTLQLEPFSQSFQPVEVVAYLPPPKRQSAVFSTHHSPTAALAQLSILPGGADLLRNIQLLPGVSASNHLAGQLNVRAGNPDENLLVLDGMLLYNIDHFYGFFSAVHPGVFDDIQVHKNNFPIQYNGRTSSIVELTSAGLSGQEKANAAIGLDLISGHGLLNLPLNDRMAMKIAGRFTHQDIANTSFFNAVDQNPGSPPPVINDRNRKAILSLSPSFHFNDLYARWEWAPDEKHQISASFFNGFDRYRYDYSESYPVVLNNGVTTTITENGRENTAWRNSAAGLNFSRKWTSDFQTQLNFSHSVYHNDSEGGFSVVQSFRNIERIRAAPESYKSNDISGWRADLKNDWNLSQSTALTFGYTLSEDRIDFQIENSNGLETRGLTRTDASLINSVYVQPHFRIGPDWAFSAGLNLQHYQKLGQFFASPRFQTSYHFSKEFSLKASWGHQQQFLRQLYHEDVFGKNQTIWALAGKNSILNIENIPIISSDNLMLGAHWEAGHWVFDVEAYHKTRNGILEYTLQRPGFNRRDGIISEPLFGFFAGKGWTNGIDFLLKKNGRKYTGWIAYTLSKSMHQLDGVNFNQAYPSPLDSRHQLNWMNQFFLHPRWTLSANYVFASGLPYLDFSEIGEVPPSRRLLSYEQFLKRFPAYHRLDLSLNYQTRIIGLETLFGLSVYNALNRNNVKYRQFVFAVEEENTSRVLGTELELLPRIWNISVEVKF